MKVYLDNGATTRVDEKVLSRMTPYFTKHYGNASSLHSFGRDAHAALDAARKIIAAKLNAEPEEIVFCSGGTESDNTAILCSARAAREKNNKKIHIITTKIEHHAVLRACEELEKEGFKLTYLDVDSQGFVDLKKLSAAITEQTSLVSIMHVNNEIGTIFPMAQIGEICSKKNVLFHSDCVQSFTKIPIDVKKININLISISAHKIHGPKGVGALFIKNGTPFKHLIVGGLQEQRKRGGTENVPGIVGFAEAASIVKKEDIKKMSKLRDRLIKGLLKLPDTSLNGPNIKNIDKRNCNNVNISFHLIEGESLSMHLDAKGIAVSTGSACSSLELQASHVLLATGLKPEIAHGAIRFTLSRHTTEEEIDYTIKAVKEVVINLRKISPFRNKQEMSNFKSTECSH